MCLAAYCESGACLTRDELATAWNANPDGAGFAYVDRNGQLVTFRSLSLDEFTNAYFDACESSFDDVPHAVHFRWATHGARDLANVHPHVVNKHTVIVHNGILPVPVSKRQSDTAIFARRYLARLPRNWMDDAALFDLVEGYAAGSKVIVVTNDERCDANFYIVNESDGAWDDDRSRWFSNQSHVACARRSANALTFGRVSERCLLCHGQLSWAPWTGQDACESCLACAECLFTIDECACGPARYVHNERVPF